MTMKLVVAIVQNEDADELIDSLTAAHFGATRACQHRWFLAAGQYYRHRWCAGRGCSKCPEYRGSAQPEPP